MSKQDDIRQIIGSLDNSYIVDQEKVTDLMLKSKVKVFLDTCFVSKLKHMDNKEIIDGLNIYADENSVKKDDIIFVITSMILYEMKEGEKNHIDPYIDSIIHDVCDNDYKVVILMEEEISKQLRQYVGVSGNSENVEFVSMMRLSSVYLTRLGEAYIIQGPAIIAMATGACFYIAEGLSKVITEVECIVIQCKEGVAKDNLLFLLGWLKSNICVWDMFNNLKANSVYVRSCYEHMEMPNPEGILFEQICNSAELILSLEDDFVDVYSKMMNESGEVAQIYVDDFNKKVSELLSYTERILCDYYNLTDEIIDTIDNDLNQKGFFVYNQNQFCNG